MCLNYIIIPQTIVVCPGSILLLRVVIRHSELCKPNLYKVLCKPNLYGRLQQTLG